MSCQSELCKSNDFIYLNHTKSSSSSPDVALAPVPGTVAGEVKLSILYKSDKLFIMVMHIRGLVSVWRCSYSYAHNARKKESWHSPMCYGRFFSNPCRTEQILIHTSNCTSSLTLRKLARGRPRQPGEHATPLTMRWWDNTFRQHSFSLKLGFTPKVKKKIFIENKNR